MLSTVMSATVEGAQGILVSVQAATENAMPQIFLSGLPNAVIRESRERVRACLVQLGFEIPSRRIVVNLSPASTPKQGSQLDLAIALGCLSAEGKIPSGGLARMGVLGELGLDGTLHPVPLAIPLLEAMAKEPSLETVVLPASNAWDASQVASKKLRLARNLSEVLLFLENKAPLLTPAESRDTGQSAVPATFLLDSIVGQSLGKFALKVALAGGHHLLLMGPPGVGKTLLATAAVELLPSMTCRQRQELLRLRSLMGLTGDFSSPFRAPHHSASASSILGGGQGRVLPGDISLAHGGVLFLDELPEFQRDVLEGLREPLQNKQVHIRRVGHSFSLPADFTLLATMNPCPCGYALDGAARCRCGPREKQQYLRRISGPLADRFDMILVLGRPIRGERATLSEALGAETRRDIARVRERQRLRTATPSLDREVERWLDGEIEKSGCSLRRADKWLRVAQTVADLRGSDAVRQEHLREAAGLVSVRPFLGPSSEPHFT